MHRHLIWIAVLLLAAAAALPAAAAGGATGAIGGTVQDGVTGKPFPTGGSHLVVIDAYHTATMNRYRVLGVDALGRYEIPNLPVGSYKVRFRYADASGLVRYLWYGGTQSFDTATPVAVLAGALARLDVTIPLTPGAPVSGTITERRSGAPLGNPDPAVACYFVQLYEASGIGIGQLIGPDLSGAWNTDGLAPAGQLTAMAGYSRWCAASPPHLDRWYGGASGWPFQPDNLVADPRTFATADLFNVTDGVAVTGIDFTLMPAPTCAGNTPTIFGTTLDDTITGTAGDDVIVGLAGRDRVFGLVGNDIICGNGGRDRLVGNGGRDRLLGNLGNDRLQGRPGDDVLRGGRGVDVADGGSGTDVCVAETTSNCP